MNRHGNPFEDLNADPGGERITDLPVQPGVRIERIVSAGQASPPGFWYDQPGGEWVIVLRGAAAVEFADAAEPHPMAAGDWLWIAPHRRHRVAWTAPDEPTVWLALHVDPVTPP